MEVEKIKNNAINVYKKSDKNVRKLLENIFGENFLKGLIWDRVKTFEDAIEELGKNHSLIKDWIEFSDSKLKNRKDIEAYMKLRIISAALNEGWEPKFMEWRYYPHFVLYTKKEIDEIDKRDRSKMIFSSYLDETEGGRIAYVYTNYTTSSISMYPGLKICFKSEELASYAGKQFIDIYANFIWK